MALEATQTLFARAHNRIVAPLPASLSQEDRFGIARRAAGRRRAGRCGSSSPTGNASPTTGAVSRRS
jgi:hypothetical protein